MNKLNGVIVPVAVPLTGAGEPDLAAYRGLLDFLLEAGVHGLFVNGSMGAFAMLSDAWQLRLAETAAEHIRGRVPLLAGVSDTSTSRVLDRIAALAHLPVDAYVAMPPFFYLLGQKEILRFYQEVADRSPKPLVLYDNPRLTKNPLSAVTVVELAAHANICGAKLSGTDVLMWQNVLRAPMDRDRFALICGAGRMSSLGLRLGFDGITEGLHNVIPSIAAALYAAARRGDHDAADRLQQRVNRCFSVFDTDGGWRGLEIAFQYLGIASRAALHPYDLQISEEKRAAIMQTLEAESVPRLKTPR